MDIQVRRAEFQEIEPLRSLFRHEANCQIVCDSILPRGLADPYRILVDGRVGGYGGIWNKYHEGRVMEFYVLPHLRGAASAIFRELLAATEATQVQAQTNIAWMLTALYDCAKNIADENILFHDGATTHLPNPGGLFRRAEPSETDSDTAKPGEPAGDWAIEKEGRIVAAGGFLTHYNPPYGDIYMEVAESERRKGYGSYIVQELKRVCYEAGRKPAARCNAANIASRMTLEKAGLLVCGRILAGDV